MPESPVLPGTHCCFSRGAALPMFILAPPVSGSVSAGSVSHLGRTGGFGCLNCLPPRTMSGFVGRGRVLITCYFSSLMWAHAAVASRSEVTIHAFNLNELRKIALNDISVHRHGCASSKICGALSPLCGKQLMAMFRPATVFVSYRQKEFFRLTAACTHSTIRGVDFLPRIC